MKYKLRVPFGAALTESSRYWITFGEHIQSFLVSDDFWMKEFYDVTFAKVQRAMGAGEPLYALM